jgi:hypothetical protein
MMAVSAAARTRAAAAASRSPDGCDKAFDRADATRAIAAAFTRVVNGELTAAERLDFVDTTISRIAQST